MLQRLKPKEIGELIYAHIVTLAARMLVVNRFRSYSQKLMPEAIDLIFHTRWRLVLKLLAGRARTHHPIWKVARSNFAPVQRSGEKNHPRQLTTTAATPPHSQGQ